MPSSVCALSGNRMSFGAFPVSDLSARVGAVKRQVEHIAASAASVSVPFVVCLQVFISLSLLFL
jgi:hypothetical protein